MVFLPILQLDISRQVYTLYITWVDSVTFTMQIERRV